MIIIDGAGGVNKANVDADGHLNVNVRPPAFQALGYYQQVAISGAIPFGLTANNILFSFRWGDATRLCMIQSVKVACMVTATLSVVGQFDLSMIIARSFTASDTGGTAVGVPANMQKMRTTMGSSLVTDFRIASTTALVAGTRTLDTNPVARVSGNYPATAPVGTSFFGSGNPVPLYLRDNVDHHPVILAQNECFEIKNPLAGPVTAGSFTVLVQVVWGELNAY
jgi:hypothetical protein